MDDGADHEIESGGAECLTVKGPVTDFTAFVEEDGALELVGCLSLVETSPATSAQCRTRIPFDHEQGPLDTAEFTERLANSLDFDEADNLLRIVDGATVRVVIIDVLIQGDGQCAAGPGETARGRPEVFTPPRFRDWRTCDRD